MVMDVLNMGTLPRAAAAPGKEAEAASKPKISSDFETFLKMLTTQMKNQDPLNPIESADYAVQLATFSGVEQQVRTNDLLEGLASSLGQTGIGQLANWVGMEVRAPTPAYHDGSGLDLVLAPKPGADRAVLVLTDASGRALARTEVAPMPGPLHWPQETGMKQNWPQGVYGFKLESWDGDQQLGEAPVEVYGRVSEAQIAKGGTQLVLEGGVPLGSDKVTAMRLPR